MTSLSKIPEGTRAVFLDAGGTLFRPYPSIGHHYRLTAAKYGCRASEKISKPRSTGSEPP